MSLSPSSSQFVIDADRDFKTSRAWHDGLAHGLAHGLARICMRVIFTRQGADDARVKEYRQRMLDA